MTKEETDAEEIERFMAMSEKELNALMTPEEWAELERLGKLTKDLCSAFRAGWNAAIDRAVKQSEDDAFDCMGLCAKSIALLKQKP